MPDKAAQKQRGSRPSIRDVARRAGVSPGCVSNVINGRRKLDDPIGRAVLQAVRDLGYRRNTMASNLRRSQSRIIGLVIPDFENPFFAELVAKLEHRAEATNYRIVATSSREDADIEAREIDELVGWRVAGVKATGTGAFGDFNAFLDAGVPASDFTDAGMPKRFATASALLLPGTSSLTWKVGSILATSKPTEAFRRRSSSIASAFRRS